MSPDTEGDHWSVHSADVSRLDVLQRKKRSLQDYWEVDRKTKMRRIAYSEIESTPHEEASYDGVWDPDEDEGSSHISLNISAALPSESITEEENAQIDDSIVVSEAEYSRAAPKRYKFITPAEEESSRGVETEELRAAGWDDDHITLVQKIARRGYEPLMPHYWLFDYRFMPTALFSESNDAFLRSVSSAGPPCLRLQVSNLAFQ